MNWEKKLIPKEVRWIKCRLCNIRSWHYTLGTAFLAGWIKLEYGIEGDDSGICWKHQDSRIL